MAFSVIGAMIFALELWVAEDITPREEQIVVSIGQVEHLVSLFQKTQNRLPTTEELNGLVDAHITEEVLYREAVRIGLDQDDTIVRRRMRQKMEFLLDDLSTREPTDEELETLLRDQPDRFETDALFSFEQAYFASDADIDFEATLSTLQSGTPVVDIPSTRGLLPDRLNEVSADQLASQYGREFADWLQTQPASEWRGPHASPFGTHFVRISHIIAAEVPPLEEIREDVRREWLSDQRNLNRDRLFNEIRSGYEIIIEDTASETP